MIKFELNHVLLSALSDYLARFFRDDYPRVDTPVICAAAASACGTAVCKIIGLCRTTLHTESRQPQGKPGMTFPSACPTLWKTDMTMFDVIPARLWRSTDYPVLTLSSSLFGHHQVALSFVLSLVSPRPDVLGTRARY